MIHKDTICAISTAPGSGGVAIIRVSGEDAISVCNKIFISETGKDIITQKPYTLQYGSIRDKEELIDEVLVAVFHAPHSFTGEDTVEINCHGSIYIQQCILRILIENGCRTALPGEYTQRAFLNGKMDLSQAEAVTDLIASSSAGMHKLALNQMRGGFSNELIKLRTRLLDFSSLIELELDFSEEDVEFANRENLKQLADKIEQTIGKLANSFSIGNAIKHGIPVAIIGETNAGKSTLLNQLLGEDKAIVSDIHGTTRDAIEDTVNIGGVTFRFIDTAGIRSTDDKIESIGIERSFQKLEQAAIVLWIIDLTSPDSQTEQLANIILPKTEGKQTILVFNKTDLLTEEQLKHKQTLLKNVSATHMYISAKKENCTEEIKRLLLQSSSLPDLTKDDIIITNIRHYEALKKAQTAIQRVQEGLSNNISGDFLSQDIHECTHYLGEITGQISDKDILNHIFERFCIGK